LHAIGILGGIIWNLGMGFSIVASTAAGPALSYGLGQGATLVGACWGVFVWKEFKDAPAGTGKLLAAMFLFYLIGLGVLIASKL
jgi:glucose uptake protein